MGTLPTQNYTTANSNTAEDISGELMYDTILKGHETCYACVVRCKRVVEIKGGLNRLTRCMAAQSMKPSERSARTAG